MSENYSPFFFSRITRFSLNRSKHCDLPAKLRRETRCGLNSNTFKEPSPPVFYRRRCKEHIIVLQQCICENLCAQSKQPISRNNDHVSVFSQKFTQKKKCKGDQGQRNANSLCFTSTNIVTLLCGCAALPQSSRTGTEVENGSSRGELLNAVITWNVPSNARRSYKALSLQVPSGDATVSE